MPDKLKIELAKVVTRNGKMAASLDLKVPGDNLGFYCEVPHFNQRLKYQDRWYWWYGEWVPESEVYGPTRINEESLHQYLDIKIAEYLSELANEVMA